MEALHRTGDAAHGRVLSKHVRDPPGFDHTAKKEVLHNDVQCTVLKCLENDNEQLLVVYIFSIQHFKYYFRVYSYLKEKVYCKTVCV
jgi:hypothetical protein